MLFVVPSVFLKVRDPVSSRISTNSQSLNVGVVDIVFPVRNPNVVPTVIDPLGINIHSPAAVVSVVCTTPPFDKSSPTREPTSGVLYPLIGVNASSSGVTTIPWYCSNVS